MLRGDMHLKPLSKHVFRDCLSGRTIAKERSDCANGQSRRGRMNGSGSMFSASGELSWPALTARYLAASRRPKDFVVKPDTLVAATISPALNLASAYPVARRFIALAGFSRLRVGARFILGISMLRQDGQIYIKK